MPIDVEVKTDVKDFYERLLELIEAGEIDEAVNLVLELNSLSQQIITLRNLAFSCVIISIYVNIFIVIYKIDIIYKKNNIFQKFFFSYPLFFSFFFFFSSYFFFFFFFCCFFCFFFFFFGVWEFEICIFLCG